jgi:hypothetical protein
VSAELDGLAVRLDGTPAALAEVLAAIAAWDATAEDKAMAEKGARWLNSVRGATLGSLIPSEEELNAMTDEEEARWAGEPSTPSARTWKPLSPRRVLISRARGLRLSRAVGARESRPRRTQRARAGASRDGPSRSGDDDPHEPEDIARASGPLGVLEGARR